MFINVSKKRLASKKRNILLRLANKKMEKHVNLLYMQNDNEGRFGIKKSIPPRELATEKNKKYFCNQYVFISQYVFTVYIHLIKIIKIFFITLQEKQ